MKFLIDRFRNKPFSEATGYDDHLKISHIKHEGDRETQEITTIFIHNLNK
jgi:hypothetical protein